MLSGQCEPQIHPHGDSLVGEPLGLAARKGLEPSTSVPESGLAEGSDVLLLAHNVTKNPLGYAWFRGETVDHSQLITSYRVDINVTTNGPTHSGREALYPNGTLLIQSVTQKDTGSYTLLVTKDDLQTERQTGHLHILRECFLSDLGVLGEVNSVHTRRTD